MNFDNDIYIFYLILLVVLFILKIYFKVITI